MARLTNEKNEEPSNLCSRCYELDFGSIFDPTLGDNRGEVYQSFPLLDAAPNKHCALCRLILDLAEERLSQDNLYDPINVHCEIGNGFFWRYSGDSPMDDTVLVKRMTMNLTFRSHATSGLKNKPDAAIPLDGMYRDPRSYSYETGLDRVGYNQMTGSSSMVRRLVPERFDIATLRKWLEVDTYQDGHPLQPANEALLRLIDSGVFRLIDVVSGNIEVPKEPVRYIALSYVWGKQTSEQVAACQLPLTKPCSILGLDRIPRTIKDSLDFVRRINERYLWIDAVCINQADPADKVVLISNMGAIYAGAYLILIAAEGKDANSGLGRLMGIETQ